MLSRGMWWNWNQMCLIDSPIHSWYSMWGWGLGVYSDSGVIWTHLSATSLVYFLMFYFIFSSWEMVAVFLTTRVFQPPHQPLWLLMLISLHRHPFLVCGQTRSGLKKRGTSPGLTVKMGSWAARLAHLFGVSPSTKPKGHTCQTIGLPTKLHPLERTNSCWWDLLEIK